MYIFKHLESNSEQLLAVGTEKDCNELFHFSRVLCMAVLTTATVGDALELFKRTFLLSFPDLSFFSHPFTKHIFA